MPYRIDLHRQPPDAFEVLVELGALDVEIVGDGLAAIMPDEVGQARLRGIFPDAGLDVSAAQGRDDGSVWVVRPRLVRVGSLTFAPAVASPQAGVIRLTDGAAFGTGLHPTTALCLEAIERTVAAEPPRSLLDVGTGSGILALAALSLGVPRVVAIDTDGVAVGVAAENARLNGVSARLCLVVAAPDALAGRWPVVVANILAAPLVEMAPMLARCLERGGHLVLSGIRATLADEVDRACRRVGMRPFQTNTRDGWTALEFRAPW